MRIHFICTGNIYRSRLAEAYLRSKNLPNVIVSSSGTLADKQHKGPITWITLRLSYRKNLLPYMSDKWTQISSRQLAAADIAVFIGKNNYEYCQQRFPIPKQYEIWDLPDFDDRDMNGKPLDIKREMECITLSENTYSLIIKKVDDLILKYGLSE